MGTLDLIERFLQNYPDTTKVMYRNLLKLRILEKFEKEIGKELIAFNSEELFEFFKRCHDDEKLKMETSVTNSFFTSISVYKRFFVWYAEEIELIRNPLNSAMISRLKEYAEGDKVFLLSKEEIEEAISDIPSSVDPDYAEFCELIIRLIFEGIQSYKDFLVVKWDAFDNDRKIISYNGIDLHISDRLCELLVYNSKETDIIMYRHLLRAKRWNNSLIKVFARADEDMDSRKIESVYNVINNIYNKYFVNSIGFKHNYKQVYYCGLYNHVVSVMGREQAHEVIMSRDRSGDNAAFKDALRSFGVNIGSGITFIKSALSMYMQ